MRKGGGGEGGGSTGCDSPEPFVCSAWLGVADDSGFGIDLSSLHDESEASGAFLGGDWPWFSLLRLEFLVLMLEFRVLLLQLKNTALKLQNALLKFQNAALYRYRQFVWHLYEIFIL